MARNHDGWGVKADGKIYLPLFRTREKVRQFCRASSPKWEIVKVKIVEVE